MVKQDLHEQSWPLFALVTCAKQGNLRVVFVFFAQFSKSLAGGYGEL
jgi:hypothetical protein